MPRAFAYTRVSHRLSAASGLSPGAQLDMCHGYYLRVVSDQADWWGLGKYPTNGPAVQQADESKALCPVCRKVFLNWRVVAEHCFDDHQLLCDPAVSARHVPLLQRPAGSKLGNIVRSGDHVIFSELDRAFRAVLDHATLLQTWETMGINVHYANLGLDLGTYSGKMVAHIMAAVAQGHSDYLSDKMRQVDAQMRKQKRKRAPRRYGFRDKRIGEHVYWLKDEEERRILSDIVRLRDEEGLSWLQIAKKLNSESRLIYREEKHRVDFFERWNPDRSRYAYHSYKKTLREEAEDEAE